MPATILTNEGAMRDVWGETFSHYLREEIDRAVRNDEPLEMTTTYLAKHAPSIEATLDKDAASLVETCILELEERVKEREIDLPDHRGLSAPWPLIRQTNDARKVGVTDLTADRTGQFLSIEGSISTAGSLLEHSLRLTYRCQTCGHDETVNQELLPWKSTEPLGCPKCEKQTKWSLIDHGDLINYRRARMAPKIGTGSGMMDERNLLLLGPLARKVTPGEEVVVHGFTVLVEEGEGFKQVIVATDIDRQTAEDRDEAGKDDLEEWRKLVDRYGDDLLEVVAVSCTPHHYGDQAARESVAVSLFSENATVDGDREAIHVLFVGDPSTGKSRLLRTMAEQMPKAIHVNAKQATRAGLTGTVMQDKQMGGHKIEPGALVLANNGACMIDELDKAPQDELTALHEAMAQLTVSLSMAGNTTLLPANTSVIAAANPTNLRWDRNEPVAEQIDLPSTVLSRFDAIHLFVDTPKEERDREIAQKVLSTGDELEEEIPADLVGRVAFHLCREFDVEIPQKVKDRLEDAFVEIRQEYTGGAIPMGQRQLAAMRRFTKAHARMHLRETATILDAEWAHAHIELWVRDIATDNLRGVTDIDLVEAPAEASQRQRVRALIEALEEHGALNEAGLQDVLGWDRFTVDKTVETLETNGELYRPDGDKLKVA